LRSRAGSRRWAAAARGGATTVADGARAVPTAVLAPGHRGRGAELLETRTLAHRLRRIESVRAAVVASVPWQWPAVMSAPAHRRVFDCADDWSDLIVARRKRLRALYARVAAEADAVIVVSAELADLFEGREVIIVPNGVAGELLVRPDGGEPAPRTMVYAGTLSDRFDAALVDEVLRLLPEWTIDIYGQCQYPGMGEQPGGALAGLLATHPGRARWHGVVERSRLSAVLDRGAVLVLPHRRTTELGGRRAWGGDVMKLYDYAARGRPIVSTDWHDDLATFGPPALRIGAGPARFAQVLQEAADEGPAAGEMRRRWAQERSWGVRWGPWAGAVFG
jgi:hypothetical protein